MENQKLNRQRRRRGWLRLTLAEKAAREDILVDLSRLEREYYERRPDPDGPTQLFGTAYYARINAPAAPEEKARLERLSPEAIKAPNLAGEPIIAKLTRAPGNGVPIGALKVVTQSGWFAARPSGTEAVYKIYAESFKDEQHLQAILADAKRIVSDA